MASATVEMIYHELVFNFFFDDLLENGQCYRGSDSRLSRSLELKK
jgi:hypothetical protein